MSDEEHPRMRELEEPFLPHKFVQLYIDGEPFLRHCVMNEDARHRWIFRDVLDEFGINFVWRDSSGESGPVQRGEGYEAVGMGTLIQRGEKDFILGHDSKEYEIGPNQAHLDALLPYLPEGIKITIGDI